MRPTGLVSVARITSCTGENIPLDYAVKSGILVPDYACEQIEDEVVIGENMFLDQGRQLMAYCMGFKAPINQYVISNFGIGTGTTVPNSTDTSLEAPIQFSTGLYTQPIDGIDFSTPFVLKASYTIGINDGNGYAITERGLFSGGGVLVARQVTTTPIVKTSDYSIALVWRIRF